MLLYDKTKNIFHDQIAIRQSRESFKSVFTLHEPSIASIKIESLSKSMIFDSSTISPKVFISDDSKTIYNYKPAGYLSQADTRYIGITKLIYCEHICVLPIQLSLSLGNSPEPTKNGIRLLSTLPESKDDVTREIDISNNSEALYIFRCPEHNPFEKIPSTICFFKDNDTFNIFRSLDTEDESINLLFFFSKQSVSVRIDNIYEIDLITNYSMPIQVAFWTDYSSVMQVHITGDHGLFEDALFFPSVALRQLGNFVSSDLGIFYLCLYIAIKFIIKCSWH